MSVFRARHRALAAAFAVLMLGTLAVPASASTPQAASDAGPSVRSGKYLITLRIPAGGLFADEETDLEFRIVDASEEDPVLGFPGVIRASIDSVITMPAMMGMPKQSEVAHAALAAEALEQQAVQRQRLLERGELGDRHRASRASTSPWSVTTSSIAAWNAGRTR